MRFSRFIIFIFIWLLFQSAMIQASTKPEPEYKRLYVYAENLSNAKNPTDQTDKLALRSYNQVISILTATPTDNPFLLKTYISMGAFMQVLNRQKEAITFFKKAFALKSKIPSVKDSILFKPLVYCGNSYYRLDQPDSAELLYNKAKMVADKYPEVNELERLYNTLGVIAYATGNYKKSLPYYEKAISILQRHSTYDNSFLVTYKNNLASAYRKLKRYDEALKIYKQLLPYHIASDQLLHNIGAVYLAMNEDDQAIKYLNQVKEENQKKLNDLGRAYLDKGNYDQALYYLQKANVFNKNLNKTHKNSDYGITLKYTGDTWVRKNQLIKGLTCYQQAIGNFLLNFNSVGFYNNPKNFNSTFNTTELLETLLAKAKALNLLYLQKNNIKDLDASLQTYLSFYKLADHIERFYDNDEARTLISTKKYESQQQPIAICLKLYNSTHNRQYIKHAFFLDEENKANTLSLYLEEAKLKAESNIPEQLLKQETELKEDITRISLQASGETASAALKKLDHRINENTIKLINVQQKISQVTGVNQLNPAHKKLDIKTLQSVIPSNSAILSYHLSDQMILCFVITNNKFEFFTKPLDAHSLIAIREIYQEAKYRSGNNKKQVKALSSLLYKKLVKPAEVQLSGIKDLMIIADAELNYVPFELLVNEDNETLLKKYTFTYNYSCTILQNSSVNNPAISIKKLGVAPFDEKIPGIKKQGSEWIQLPASKIEIGMLQGNHLFGKMATKQEFLRQASGYQIIHLATHAYANDSIPNQSYIVFYPANPDSVWSYKLYQPEIYNLKLANTHLIILSACESGAGKFVKGEGVMSLSRAFSYAGCANIITSMWKADDASTAYIAGKLHYYLQNGYGMARALQQAKLDYLDDSDFTSAKKLPGYWAHLRLIGNFEKQASSNHWLYVIAISFVTISFIVFIIRNRLKQPRMN